MIEVSLFSGHLPPQGARFPDRCVVCANPVETSAERPIEVGSMAGALQAFSQGAGPQQRVPIHLDTCHRQLRREHFREHAAPLLLFLGLMIPGLLIGWLAGMSAGGANLFIVVTFGISLPLMVWMNRRVKRVFAIRQEMDDRLRGLFTYQFGNAELAENFRKLNENALFKVKAH